MSDTADRSDTAGRGFEVLVAKGEQLTPRDKSLLTQILGKFGLTTEYFGDSEYQSLIRRESLPTITYAVDPQYENARGHAPVIADITRPEQFLVREHVENLFNTYPIEQPQGSAGRLFNYLIDGPPTKQGQRRWSATDRRTEDGTSWVSRAINTPANLEVKPRTDVGFEPYPRDFPRYGRNNICAAFALNAGSVVDFAETYVNNTSPTLESHIKLLGAQLQSQF